MTTPIALGIGSSHFWTTIDKSIKANSYAFIKDGSLFCIVFEDSVKMLPIVRTNEVMFTSLVSSESSSQNLLAVINAQVYGMNTRGMIDYGIGNDPVTPEGIDPEGLVVRDGGIVAGRAASLNFFVANYINKPQKYKFGFGAAPTNASASIGGAGPLIINGLPYGPINRYRAGTTPGRLTGKPSLENAKNLTQRSNLTFNAFTQHAAAPQTGITAIAYSSRRKKLAILVHPDWSGAMPLSQLRDKLLSAGFDNGIFLDGSDSSMLMVENTFYSRPANSKNKTNNIGIGFKY